MNTSGQSEMTAGSHKKYLFDNDFGMENVPPTRVHKEDPAATESEAPTPDEETVETQAVEETPPPPSYSEEDLARAREEGVQAGRDEATRDLSSAMEQRLANAMDAINAQITTLFDAYDRDKEEHSRDAVSVATVIVRKLFPALNMDKAMAEIEHMIVEAMKRTSADHPLIIRAPKDMHREVEDKVKELAALRGREGALNVVVDETMNVGDVAVEWEGGGMVRDTQLIWREIDEIIERNLGQKPTYASPEAAQMPDQMVVKPAQVGENEEKLAESAQTGPNTDESDDEPNT